MADRWRGAERGNVAGAVGVMHVAPVGWLTCCDLRFAEQARIAALRGADVLVVSAAFTAVTGPPHWEVLLQARAQLPQVSDRRPSAYRLAMTITPQQSLASWSQVGVPVDANPDAGCEVHTNGNPPVQLFCRCD